MLLSSPHFLFLDKERRQERQRTNRTQPQGMWFMILPEQMEAWCISKLQQISMLRREFSPLPAKMWNRESSLLLSISWPESKTHGRTVILFRTRICVYSMGPGITSSYSTKWFGLTLTLQITTIKVWEWLEHRMGFGDQKATEQLGFVSTEGLWGSCGSLMFKWLFKLIAITGVLWLRFWDYGLGYGTAFQTHHPRLEISHWVGIFFRLVLFFFKYSLFFFLFLFPF